MATNPVQFSTEMPEASGTVIQPTNNGATITFDASYFTKQDDTNSFQYGLNDKIMLKDSIKYLEHMQQPFYTKFITVSNHYPYTTSLIGDEIGFLLQRRKMKPLMAISQQPTTWMLPSRPSSIISKLLVFMRTPLLFCTGTTTVFLILEIQLWLLC